MPYDSLPSPEILATTAEALTANGFQAIVVNSGDEAKAAVLERIPKGAEVMTMTSKTTEAIGLDAAINTSGEYKPVRELLNDPDVDGREKKRYGAAPEWSTGSVHAITQDGRIMIASATGSQLPAHVYGADHVVFIVGAQKIVKDLDDGTKRIYEYVLPLESERARQAYGVPGSSVNDLLIMHKANPFAPGRITVILVNEVLGF